MVCLKYLFRQVYYNIYSSSASSPINTYFPLSLLGFLCVIFSPYPSLHLRLDKNICLCNLVNHIFSFIFSFNKLVKYFCLYFTFCLILFLFCIFARYLCTICPFYFTSAVRHSVLHIHKYLPIFIVVSC